MLVRVDDFPSLAPKEVSPEHYYEDYRDRALQWIKPFEENNLNYILGVTPFLLNEGDVEFLNDNIKSGSVVMHGFDHAFSLWKMLNTFNIHITKTWESGGEFSNMEVSEIRNRYVACDKILSKIDSYDDTHFIPPFNAITQTLIDFLNDETNVTTIHDTSICYHSQKHERFYFRDLTHLVAESDKESADINTVLRKLNKHTKYVVLHWIFDMPKLNKYKEFAKRVGKM